MAGTFQWETSTGNWLGLYRSLTPSFSPGGFYTAISSSAGSPLTISYDGQAQSDGRTGVYDVQGSWGPSFYPVLVDDSARLTGEFAVRFDASGFTASVNFSSGRQGDILVGGLAADRLRGGLGADTLTGGAGDDVFFGALEEFAGDVITDFSVGDVIEIFDAAGQTAVLGEGNVLTIGGVDITLDVAADYSGYVLRQNDLFGYRVISLALPSVTITDIDADKDEGPAGAVTPFKFRVTRDGALDQAESVTWTVSGAGQDPVDDAEFVTLTGVAEFEPGEDAVEIIVEVRGDDDREPHELFVVTLSDPQGVALGTDTQAWGWVRNDDGPNQTIWIDDQDMWTSLRGAEGWTGETREMSVLLRRSGDLDQPLEVAWSVGPVSTGASADGEDFEDGVWPSGAALFDAGSATAIVRFYVRGDAQHEPKEGFTFTIDPDPAKVAFDADKLSITGEILNDDATSAPKVSIRAETLRMVEGDDGDQTPFTFVVERSGDDLSEWSQVRWRLTPSGAHPADLDDMVEDQDYEGWLNFAPGETTKTVTLLLKGDKDPEPDETFSIVITASGADVDVDRIDGVIVDDDSPTPEPQPQPQPEPEPQPNPQPQPQPSLTPERIEGGFGAAAGLQPGSIKTAAPTITLPDGTTAANPAYQTAIMLTDLIARFEAGLIDRPALVDGVVQLARPTSAVALQAYQFFTGASPSQAGLSWLVDSPDNPNDLTDAYYARFNETNRYLNFAVNLGVEGEGANAFAAGYAALDFAGAVRKAYDVVIGLEHASAKGVDIDAALAWLTEQQAYFESFAGSALGGKAAMVGYLMFAGMQEKVGRYFEATHGWLEAAFDGDANYGAPLVGVASTTTADLAMV